MVNLSALNSAALNASATEPDSGLFGGGTIVFVEQSVLREASGTVISFEQDVVLYSTAGGTLISVEQAIRNIQAGTLIAIEQNIIQHTSAPAVTPPGTTQGPYWDLIVTIDGNVIPSDWIHGEATVSRTESSTGLMEITLITPPGVQDFDVYTGKTITADVLLPGLVTRRIYTGIVDIPEVDLINKKVTLRCSDRREEKLATIIGPFLSDIGTYSDTIFGEDKSDSYKELESRLSTTPTAVDFDSFGNLRITPWAAKPSPDYLLTDADVYRRRPHVEFASRARITNAVDIKFQYRYERLHQWEAQYQWESPIHRNFGLFLLQGYTMARRDMILEAIRAAGWPVKGDVNFVQIQPAGWYSGIAWKTSTALVQTVVQRDSSGATITDSDGNPVLQTIYTGAIDLRTILANGANWTATTRWAQTVTEDHSMVVKAPQSIAQYGTIVQNSGYSIRDLFDSSVWEAYTSYNEVPGKSNTYFIDGDSDRARFNSASRVALLRARNTILGSHRDTRVSITRDIWPQVELHNTVQVQTEPVKARGKVSEIRHYFNVSTREAKTDVIIVLSKSNGSASDSNYVAPGFGADVVNLPTPVITLGNHFGVNPDPAINPDSVNWTGMIGNKYIPGQLHKTNYVDQFRVDTPEIPTSVRDERIRTKTTEYDVEIPDDFLIVTF